MGVLNGCTVGHFHLFYECVRRRILTSILGYWISMPNAAAAKIKASSKCLKRIKGLITEGVTEKKVEC